MDELRYHFNLYFHNVSHSYLLPKGHCKSDHILQPTCIVDVRTRPIPGYERIPLG